MIEGRWEETAYFTRMFSEILNSSLSLTSEVIAATLWLPPKIGAFGKVAALERVSRAPKGVQYYARRPRRGG
jgi:hypothetical protein